MIDAMHYRILGGIWGLKNWNKGNRERAARWFALADKYQEDDTP